MRRVRPQDIEVPDAGAMWIARTATDSQKFALLARLWRGHLERVRASVAQDHPDWDAARQAVEVAAIVSDRDPDVIEAARQRGRLRGAE